MDADSRPNLMHDIVEGKLTAEEARRELGEQQAAWWMNREAPYTEGIRFPQPAESETGYLDEPVMKAPTVRQAVGKVNATAPGAWRRLARARFGVWASSRANLSGPPAFR